MKRLALLAALTAVCGVAPLPVAAQGSGVDKVNTVIVFGDDECPSSSETEIVVCARMDEGERFRIPPNLRQSNNPANEAWTNRVRRFEAVGNFGPLSCTPVGAGGELGCTAEMIAAAFQERRSGPSVRAAELIAAAREERLSTIDAEAAAAQARVEEIERQYLERNRREEAGEVQPRPPSDVPVVVDPADIAPR